MKTLVLLSGGLDSAVVLAAMVKQGRACEAMGFDYGHRHVVELEHAEEIAHHYGVAFEVVTLLDIDIPKLDDAVFAGRNLVFASIAIATAQARGLEAVAVGCNASDWQRFPDCRPPFWSALARCAEAYGVQVITPLIHASKIEVVEMARSLGVPIDMTWSCYDPIMDPEHGDHRQCGKCLACGVRQAALEYVAA